VKLTRYVTQLLKGNTDVLILSTLEREPMYGHQILEAIEVASDGTLSISEGTLYPALQRLTREGRIRPRWTTLPSGKERKYYVITPKGERWLAECRSQWGEFAAAFGRVARGGASG